MLYNIIFSENIETIEWNIRIYKHMLNNNRHSCRYSSNISLFHSLIEYFYP